MNPQKLQLNNFNLTEIVPQGWIKRQLEIQLAGLSGHLQNFWPDIKNSAWFGGTAEGWERAPYWLDGMIPLVYLLDKKEFIRQIDDYMDYILEHQQEDGWLGPKNSNTQNPEAKESYDIWAQFLILKILSEYYELKKNPRIIEAVERGLKKIDESINWTPLFDWGQARWFEALIPIIWLYEKTEDQWLLSLAVKLQAQGFSWDVFFRDWPMTEATPKGGWNFMSHVVNNAMATKAYALVYRLKGNPAEKATMENMISLLDKHHGTAVGTITGDECLAGKSPLRGTELCSAVELMYSYEHILKIFGEAKFADKIEKIAFNALPAYFTNDMWCHQYNQQVNQIAAVEDPRMPWGTNEADANIYGLEPHFGCCTSNYHQGFPKFVANSWLKTVNNDIVSALFISSTLNTSIENKAISIELNTNYPFENCLNYQINNQEQIKFNLWIRIPDWCDHCNIQINNDSLQISESGTFYPVLIENSCIINIEFITTIKFTTRQNNAISIEYGALVFAYPLTPEINYIHQDKPYREFPHCDIEMRSTDNCYIALNKELGAKIFRQPVSPELPYNPLQPPITIEVNGAEYKQRTINEVVMTEHPLSPLNNISADKRITLVPFGLTRLRVGEFPYF